MAINHDDGMMNAKDVNNINSDNWNGLSPLNVFNMSMILKIY